MSNHAEAWRLVALAKADRQSGRHGEAEARLRECRARFPRFGPAAAALADIIGAEGRHEEALAAWKSLVVEFAETVQPWWLTELAKAERRSGQNAEAEAHLRTCRARFPDFGPAAAALADLLGARGRHEDCLAEWEALVVEFSQTLQPWWLIELAKAERRSGRNVEAEAHLRECRARFPAHGPAAAALAEILGAEGRHEEALAAWQALVAEFAETLQPWWLIELARAERRSGWDVEAVAHLRECRARFPSYGPAAAAFADALAALGDHEGSLAVWKSAIDEFSQLAQPWWHTAHAASCLALGRPEEAERALDARDVLFPDAPDAIARRAEAAAKAEDWETAREVSATCIDRFRESIKPGWLNVQALALFRLWRVEEAWQVWADLTDRFPDFIHGRLALAAAAREIGHWTRAQQAYCELIARHRDAAKPEWFADLARALLGGGEMEAARLTIDELEARFPDSALGGILAIERGYAMQSGVNAILPKIEAALARFPSDRFLLAEYIRALLASGRQDEAAAALRDMEAAADDHYAVIGRLRFVMDRDGEAALEAEARGAVGDRDPPLPAGLAIGTFLLTMLSSWAVELAQALFDRLDARFPGRVAIAVARARAHIVLRQDEAALSLIHTLPTAFQTNETRELKAWAAARSGEPERARAIWRTILSQAYFPSLNSPAPNLQLLKSAEAPSAGDSVVAFVKIRNEMAHLREFLRHHRQIGVARFVFIDNMSTDEGAAYLAAQPDVTLYQTADGFQTSGAGMRWINVLRERHGMQGWTLHADADERFIYPGWETTPLTRLIAYLEREGAEAVAAFMLDVYPEALSDEGQAPDPLQAYRYYDASYTWFGQVRPPYFQPVGGMRERLFLANEILHKVPLVRDVSTPYIGSHNTIPTRFSCVSALLLHYKLRNLALRFAAGPTARPFVASRSPEIMRRHIRYAARLGDHLNARLVRPEVSETLTDSLTLADRGLMQAPAEFRHWLGEVR